jgi:hypothetical protein
MSGAIPPLPQYAFMAWCSVKKKEKYRDNFTFTLPFLNSKVKEVIPVLNKAPRHEDVLGEWKYSSTHF